MDMVARRRGNGIDEAEGQSSEQLQLADRASGSEAQGEGKTQSSAVERVDGSNQLQGPGARSQGAGQALAASFLVH